MIEPSINLSGNTGLLLNSNIQLRTISSKSTDNLIRETLKDTEPPLISSERKMASDFKKNDEMMILASPIKSNSIADVSKSLDHSQSKSYRPIKNLQQLFSKQSSVGIAGSKEDPCLKQKIRNLISERYPSTGGGGQPPRVRTVRNRDPSKENSSILRQNTDGYKRTSGALGKPPVSAKYQASPGIGSINGSFNNSQNISSLLARPRTESRGYRSNNIVAPLRRPPTNQHSTPLKSTISMLEERKESSCSSRRGSASKSKIYLPSEFVSPHSSKRAQNAFSKSSSTGMTPSSPQKRTNYRAPLNQKPYSKIPPQFKQLLLDTLQRVVLISMENERLQAFSSNLQEQLQSKTFEKEARTASKDTGTNHEIDLKLNTISKNSSPTKLFFEEKMISNNDSQQMSEISIIDPQETIKALNSTITMVSRENEKLKKKQSFLKERLAASVAEKNKTIEALKLKIAQLTGSSEKVSPRTSTFVMPRDASQGSMHSISQATTLLAGHPGGQPCPKPDPKGARSSESSHRHIEQASFCSQNADLVNKNAALAEKLRQSVDRLAQKDDTISRLERDLCSCKRETQRIVNIVEEKDCIIDQLQKEIYNRNRISIKEGALRAGGRAGGSVDEAESRSSTDPVNQILGKSKNSENQEPENRKSNEALELHLNKAPSIPEPSEQAASLQKAQAEIQALKAHNEVLTRRVSEAEAGWASAKRKIDPLTEAIRSWNKALSETCPPALPPSQPVCGREKANQVPGAWGGPIEEVAEEEEDEPSEERELASRVGAGLAGALRQLKGLREEVAGLEGLLSERETQVYALLRDIQERDLLFSMQGPQKTVQAEKAAQTEIIEVPSASALRLAGEKEAQLREALREKSQEVESVESHMRAMQGFSQSLERENHRLAEKCSRLQRDLETLKLVGNRDVEKYPGGLLMGYHPAPESSHVNKENELLEKEGFMKPES